MIEIDAEVLRRLVVRHKADGRAVYDPQAKAEVVRLCLRPGVSVARMALQCGINANLLRRWITQGLDVSMRASKATVPALPDVPETPTVAALAPGASPHVFLVVGVNGTGKTTTAAKMAYQFKRKGLRVMLAAADTFRAGRCTDQRMPARLATQWGADRVARRRPEPVATHP